MGDVTTGPSAKDREKQSPRRRRVTKTVIAVVASFTLTAVVAGPMAFSAYSARNPDDANERTAAQRIRHSKTSPVAPNSPVGPTAGDPGTSIPTVGVNPFADSPTGGQNSGINSQPNGAPVPQTVPADVLGESVERSDSAGQSAGAGAGAGASGAGSRGSASASDQRQQDEPRTEVSSATESRP